jgi:hypothetical protein
MGLYLCVFDGDEELDGVEVGRYVDFDVLRTAIATHLEDGRYGSRYRVLQMHVDSDGEWSPEESEKLEAELREISARLRELPSGPYPGEWQAEVAKSMGLSPTSLYDCFIDVDGEPLLERLIGLCQLSLARSLPILFQ